MSKSFNMNTRSPRPNVRYGEKPESLTIKRRQSKKVDLSSLGRLFMDLAPQRKQSKKYGRTNSRPLARRSTDASAIERTTTISLQSKSSKVSVKGFFEFNPNATDQSLDTVSEGMSETSYIAAKEGRKIKEYIGKTLNRPGHISQEPRGRNQSSKFGFLSKRFGQSSRLLSGNLYQKSVSRSMFFPPKKYRPKQANTSTLRERPQRSVGSLGSFIGEIPRQILQAFAQTDNMQKKKIKIKGKVQTSFDSEQKLSFTSDVEDGELHLTASKIFRSDNGKARTDDFFSVEQIQVGDDEVQLVQLGDPLADFGEEDEDKYSEHSDEFVSSESDSDEHDDTKADASEKPSMLSRKNKPTKIDERSPKVSDTTDVKYPTLIDDDDELHFADETDLLMNDANDLIIDLSRGLVEASGDDSEESDLHDGVTDTGLTKFEFQDMSDLSYINGKSTDAGFIDFDDDFLFDSDSDMGDLGELKDTLFGPDMTVKMHPTKTEHTMKSAVPKQRKFRMVRKGKKKLLDFETVKQVSKPVPRATRGVVRMAGSGAPKKFRRTKISEEDEPLPPAKSDKKVRFASQAEEEKQKDAKDEFEKELKELALTVKQTSEETISTESETRSKFKAALKFLEATAKIKNNPSAFYKVERTLGNGAFGEVKKCRDQRTEQLVAVKICELKTEDAAISLANEVKIMQETRDCPFLIRYFESLRTHQQKIWMSMELCEAGDISTLMDVCGVKLNETQIVPIVAAVGLGLEFLHGKNIIHRDVKCGNIMLGRNGLPKLGDFGISRHVEDNLPRSMTFTGSPYWMAPEVIRGRHVYNKAVDIWSLGITICEMFDGVPPLFDLKPMDACKKIIEEEYLEDCGLSTTNTPLGAVLSSFVDGLLEPEMNNRPTVKSIINHSAYIAEAARKLRHLQKHKLLSGEVTSEAAVQFGGRKRRGGWHKSMQVLAPLKELVDEHITKIEEYHLKRKKRRDWQNRRRKK